MLFNEFKDWLLALDHERGGRPPDLAQWWELKARLEAVDGGVASSPVTVQQPSAVPRNPSRVAPPTEDTVVEDFPAPESHDPEPGDFRRLSLEKDGGLMAEAVDTLRRPGPPSRSAP